MGLSAAELWQPQELLWQLQEPLLKPFKDFFLKNEGMALTADRS